MENYVIVYDIRDDRRRNKIFQTLKNYATPIQYSVFEARLQEKDLIMLRHKLCKLIKKDEDSLIFYYRCEACKDRVERLGTAPEPYGEGDIII